MAAKPVRSKSQRKLTPRRIFVYRLAVCLARAILEVLWYTGRVRIVGAERLQVLLQQHGVVIPVCWHQHLLQCGRYLVSDLVPHLKPGFMISPSVDGEAPTMLARSYGAHVVRGSGSYTGLRAVRGVKQAIDDGISPTVTPDGPRGPRFKFKAGAIFASQISGKPVVPLAFAARPAFVLRTWDKFVLTVPFGRVCIAIGEPFFAPAELTDTQREAAQRELERRLHATYREAKAALEGRRKEQRE